MQQPHQLSALLPRCSHIRAERGRVWQSQMARVCTNVVVLGTFRSSFSVPLSLSACLMALCDSHFTWCLASFVPGGGGITYYAGTAINSTTTYLGR